MRKAIVTLAVAACACAALAVERTSAKPGVKATVCGAGSVWSVPVIDLFTDSGLYPCEPAQAMFFHDAKTDMLHPNTDGQRRMALILQFRMLALPSDFKDCAKK